MHLLHTLIAAFWYCMQQIYSIMQQIFLKLISSFRLIFHVKPPPFLNFQFDTTNGNSKNLYTAFQLLYAANMQHYAAIGFFSLPPFLDWFVMWNHLYWQIFSVTQLIVEAKTHMQHLYNFMQQICSIMLQIFFSDEHPF